MNVQTLQAGLIGFGYAGKTFHAPLIGATPGLTLAAVSSSDAGKVRASLGDGPVVFASPQDLIAEPSLDLVVIASPNATHFALASAALAAGKHVVVDKPFAASFEEAGRLTVLAREQGRLLSVFHNRRWDSTTRTVKRLLAAGTLGEIRYAAMHYDRFRPRPCKNTWLRAAALFIDERPIVGHVKDL